MWLGNMASSTPIACATKLKWKSNFIGVQMPILSVFQDRQTTFFNVLTQNARLQFAWLYVTNSSYHYSAE